MHIWLASYPRSGNTYLRMLLKQFFDKKTTSIYPDDMRFFSSTPELKDLIGHVEKSETASCDPGSFIKTHHFPEDDAPAIYIVRDGRAVIVSYYHYRKTFERDDNTIEDIIRNCAWPCGWSEHISAWQPTIRKKTLLIRYEDMLDRTSDTVETIGRFLDLQPLQKASIDFNALHERQPDFFRTGNNDAAYAEIEPHLDLFDHYHGQTMRDLGYYSAD